MEYLNKIICGDCLEVMKKLPDNSIDSIVTDPPYELGFMGKSWDNTGIANDKNMWAECLRVLKPGGHLLAFSGTRTYHRMACAIEDAGFEVRDMIEWVYGSGFPKSLNIGKVVDKLNGIIKEELPTEPMQEATEVGSISKNRRCSICKKAISSGNPCQCDRTYKADNEWEGWGTALKPAHEPICMARKHLAEKTVAENVLKYGTGGINIDESRVGTTGARNNGNSQGTVGSNSIGVYGKAIKQDYNMGRFPANLIHDNSEEVRECFPDAKGWQSQKHNNFNPYGGNAFNKSETTRDGFHEGYNDSGNASRFFKSIIYQAKASKSERNKGCEGLEVKGRQGKMMHKANNTSDEVSEGFERFDTQPSSNNHPTVKPIALMEYLIKMVTPKGGIVLDPFAGSGSTLVAAKQNDFKYIGIELTEEYIPIIEARLSAVKNLQGSLL